MLILFTCFMLTIVSVYLGYRVWFLAGKLAESQDYIEEIQTYIENLEVTNQYMYSRIELAHKEMKRIDLRQAFEKDDETGTTFQLLFEVIDELKGEFDGESEEK